MRTDAPENPTKHTDNSFVEQAVPSASGGGEEYHRNSIVLVIAQEIPELDPALFYVNYLFIFVRKLPK